MELGSEYNLPISELNIKENNLFHYLEDYNSIYTDSGRSALFNANTLISLPIDQRYGKPEMDYLIDTVKSYGGALSL